MAWQTPKTDWQPVDGLTNEDMNRVEGNVQFLYEQTKNAEVRDRTISERLSIIHTDQATPLHLNRLEGRTVVNHVPLFDSGLWSLNSGIVISSPTSITITGVSGTYVRARSPRIYVKPSTTYTLSFDLDNETGLGYVEKHRVDGSIIGNVTSRTFVTESDCAYVIVQLDNRQLSGTFTFNNVAINEGSTAQEFVAGMKNLSGFYMKRYGKNLLPPFSEWAKSSTNGVVEVVDQYRLKIVSEDGLLAGLDITIPASPNTSYTYTNPDSGRLVVHELDSERNIIANRGPSVDGTIISFTSSPNAKYFRVHANTINAGSYWIINPTLNLGPEPLPFEPQNNDYLFADVELASNANAKDVLEYRDGRYWKVKRFNKVVLDGRWEWALAGSLDGFRTIRIPKGSGFAQDRKWSDAGVVGVKYDGSILNVDNASLSPDTIGIGVWMNPNDPSSDFLLSVKNGDSGWVSGVAPNSNAIKALMNGWKAAANNGTVYTAWESILNPSETSTDEDYVANYKANGWEGWATLQYQLAEPVIEDVTDQIEGAISLYEGDNQVEMGEAVVVREVALPKQNSNTGSWFINEVGGTSNAEDSPLKHYVNDVVAVYKDGALFTKWIYFAGAGLQNGKAVVIFNEDYDPTATYTVTYIAAPWQLSSAAQSVDVQYTANVKTALDRNIQDVADLSTRVSTFPSIYARKHQEQWIVPTLLNGWTSIGGTCKYYKDQFGRVHLQGRIGNGTTTNGTVIFYLPPNYRPTSLLEFPSAFWNAGSYYLSGIKVQPDGRVTLQNVGANTALYLDGISFRAGQ